jgi:hypothetical protein
MPETIPDHIEDAVRRPWAQVMQFAIEMHLAPDSIIQEMLDRDDDAFCTSLRLIGRCIANGAFVDMPTRDEVGRRLTAYWSGAPTTARGRVGSLIVDGFSRPVGPALRDALHKPWLLNDGAGEIITRTKDRELTLSVLQSLLEGKLDHSNVYHSLKPAFSAVGDDAFKAIFQRARQIRLGKERLSALEGLLAHFLPGSVSRSTALGWASDTQLPRSLRLLAYSCAGAPLEQDAERLLKEGLRSLDPEEFSPTCELLALHPDRAELLLAVLLDGALLNEHKRKLASGVTSIFPEQEERLNLLRKSSMDLTLDPELRAMFRLLAARYGDLATFNLLVREIAVDPPDIAACTVSLFGHYQDRELAILAAELARARVQDGTEAVRFANAAVLQSCSISSKWITSSVVCYKTHLLIPGLMHGRIWWLIGRRLSS